MPAPAQPVELAKTELQKTVTPKAPSRGPELATEVLFLFSMTIRNIFVRAALPIIPDARKSLNSVVFLRREEQTDSSFIYASSGRSSNRKCPLNLPPVQALSLAKDRHHFFSK
jgi:hypothetical protein